MTARPLLVVASLLAGGLVAYLVLSQRGGGPAGGGAEPLPVLGAVPEFELTDAGGEPVGLEQLLGKAWVANFIFTRCPATCPAQSKNLAALQGKLDGSPIRDRVRLVSVTVDPDHDTPDVLTAYARANGAKPGFWHFLRGPADDAFALSRDGFKLAAGRATKPDAGPTHSAKFALVDPWGQIRGYYDGESAAAADDLIRDIGRVIDEPAATVAPVAESAARRDPTQHFDEVLKDTKWLRTRQREQLAEAKGWAVPHAFGFADRRADSGITFRHRVVDDAAGRWKAVHYDHGNGVLAADVDGDGRTDLFFVNQVGACQLWRNLGGGKFEDVTARAGVALPEPIKVTASFADIDNDGSPDLFVTTVRGGTRLFRNDGTGRFTDVTAASGLAVSGHHSVPLFFDFDRDGRLDLFLCDVGVFTTNDRQPVTTPGVPDPAKYEYFEAFPDAFSGHLKPERAGRCLLFRNLGGGKFADVTKETGLGDHVGWAGDATPIDGNGDGWPDLYVLNMQGNDEYYENQGGKRFVRKRGDVFPRTPWGSMGAKVFDFNADGRLDLFVTDMHSDMPNALDPDVPAERAKSRMTWPETFLTTQGASIFGNALYESRGPNQYREVSDAAGAEMYWPWGPSVGDLNADGFADVFVTAGMSYPYRYGPNSVLLNEGGQRFRHAEFVVGVEPRRGRRTAMPWFDKKADGGKPTTVWSSLSTRSAILFDIDDDGDLDIVTNEFNAEPQVLVSDLGERTAVRFLKVKLVGGMTPDAAGGKSNRDGLGAVVRVRTGGREVVQVHDGRDGYLSQGQLPLYFGLGGAAAVDAVEVTWPTGKTQTVPGPIQANTTLTVREP